jgi:hypothetical protein
MHLSVADDADRQLQLAALGDSSVVGNQATAGIAFFPPEIAQQLIQRHMGSAYIGPSAARATSDSARLALPIARGELPIPDSDRLRFPGPQASRLVRTTAAAVDGLALPAIEDAASEVIDPYEVASVQTQSGPLATADEQLDTLLVRHRREGTLIDLNDEHVSTCTF